MSRAASSYRQQFRDLTNAAQNQIDSVAGVYRRAHDDTPEEVSSDVAECIRLAQKLAADLEGLLEQIRSGT